MLERLDSKSEFLIILEQQLKKPRFRVKKPAQPLYPIAQEKKYAAFIKALMRLFTNITNESLKPQLGSLVKEFKKESTPRDSVFDKGIRDGAIDSLEFINAEYQEQQDIIFKNNIEGLKNIYRKLEMKFTY